MLVTMCGRYVVARAAGDLMDDFGADDGQDETLLRPNYNVAPTTDVPVVLERLDESSTVVRELHVARWGLLPRWAKDASFSSRAFNARSETVAEKPTFRAAVKKTRCVVPADGYYEWLAPASKGAKKIPHYIHPADGSPIAFAGLYSWWKDPATEEWVLTCSILTGPSPDPEAQGVLGELGRLHDRLPLALPDEAAIAAWLDPEATNPEPLVEGVRDRAYEAASAWEIHPVGSAVGNVRNNGPELISAV
jgi:putative SOS response-associated peptidase YedK